MSVRTRVAPVSVSLRPICSSIAPKAPVIRIVLSERSMLIMASLSINSREHFVTGFGDQHVVFDSCAPAPLGNIYTRLDRNHHAGLQLGGFSGRYRKTRIVIAKTNVMAGVMSKESRKSIGRDFVSCYGVNVTSRSSRSDGIQRSLLRSCDNVQHLLELGIRPTP